MTLRQYDARWPYLESFPKSCIIYDSWGGGGVMPHGMIIDKIMDDNPRLPTKTKKGLHTFPELSIFRP